MTEERTCGGDTGRAPLPTADCNNRSELLAVDHSLAVEQSRAALLEEIGEGRELTLLRGVGNVGDELIRAGTHRLLQAHVFREVEIDDLPACSGDTVLLPGSGAWCRPYHEWMPRALAIAELRFDRVIVLPSSFDVSEDSVRHALRSTRATVFAREAESQRRIEGLCRALLAHDCAFFFDYSGYRAPGSGTLNAFRTDREATGGELALNDNDDISATAASLEVWLAEIERHALVRTDRAHVMIAAALMGKEVEFAPASYHKLQALAASWLDGLPVRRIGPPPRRRTDRSPIAAPAAATREQLRAVAAPPPSSADAAASATRITAVVLTHERPDLAVGAVRSVTATTVPVRVLVIDNNSGARTRKALAALAVTEPRIDLRLADRNLGCAGGRQLAVELVDSEFVLFLDDDAELIDGALEHLLADLDAHPDAAGVTARVVGPDGQVQHYGGGMEVSDEAVRFTLYGTGLRFDDPSLPLSGHSGWAPGTASLMRTAILREVAIDAEMAAYYEDNDWCYRVEQRRPGSFRRCREALVLHHHDYDTLRAPSSRLVERYEIVERLAAQARFLHANGVLLDVDLAATLPELRRRDGGVNMAAVRLLLELITARGVDWTVMEWMNDGLDPLLDGGDAEARIGQLEAHAEVFRRHAAGLEAHNAELEAQVEALQGHAGGLEAQVEALQGHAGGLEAQVEALQGHAGGLEAQVEALQGHAGGLEAQVEALQGHAGGLEAQVAGLERQVEALRAHTGGLASHSAGLEKQVEALDAHAGGLAARSIGLEARVEALQGHAGGLEAHRERLEAQVEALQAHTCGLEARSTGLGAQVQALQGHAAGLGAEVKGLRAEQTETRAQLAWLRDRHITLCQVEAGGWWRLRSHLLPLLRVASQLRSILGKGS